MPLHLATSPHQPAEYANPERAIISVAASDDVRALISQCPAYEPTPLHTLLNKARALGIGSLQYKDESFRFGLNAFKALGGTYAVGKVLLNYIEKQSGRQADFKTLAEGGYKDLISDITVTCASAGNHGRAVAAGAKHFGCHAVIFLPNDAADEREQMIKDTGADIIRHTGDYDDTLVVAENTAREKNWIVISDTAWPGYEDIPQTVMIGYTVMIAEAVDQLMATKQPLPTHVFIQGGVGGVAAAVAGYLADRYGTARPMVIVVEPEAADCLYNSSRQGRLSESTGSGKTFMGPLNCRAPSSIAWAILSKHADAFMTISDAMAQDVINQLKTPIGDDPLILVGPAGCASTAGLCHVADSEVMRGQLKLDENSRVLVFGTEGALPS